VGSLGVLSLLAACAGGSGAAADSSPSPAASFLQSDPSTKSVTLTLISSYDSDNAGFNFDGYDSGKMVVSVPDGWKVTVNCGNKGTSFHSCAIVNKGGDQTPAIQGASTPNPTGGFPPGATQTFTFTASSPATYRISCLVPGHDDSGMWDTFIVTSSGEPSISFK
jgi:hypothetical protein